MKETTACSRELGFELRRRREAVGLSSVELADRLGWSHTKIWRLERGWRGAAEMDVTQYLSFLGFSLGEMRGLRALCREVARDLGYWLGGIESLGFHESSAEVIVSYCPEIVPAVLRVADPSVLRPGPRRAFLLHDRVLAGLATEQVMRLLVVADVPFLEVRVVRAGEVFGGGFRVLEFAEHHPLVYVEGEYVGLFVEDHEAVTSYCALANRIMDAALDVAASRELLAGLAAETQVGSQA